MEFFADCTTIEELKKKYHKLVFQFHPDRGGDEETVKRINTEYETAFEKLKGSRWGTGNKSHTQANGGNAKNADGQWQEAETPQEFMIIINKLARIQNIVIEICGSWIWVTGDTFPHKDELSRLNFHWSRNKTAWYWHRDGDGSRSRKRYTMDEIRDIHGSKRYDGTDDKTKSMTAV